METTVINATEYRNVSLSLLSESRTNPRRIFEDVALKELANSIRSQGVLSPLLVRPLTEQGFEIVAGARRYRAAQRAEVATVPVRIVNLSAAGALEAQLIENLQRRDVHPMEEAQGFRSLLNLEKPKYSIEQIAAKTGKSPSYVTTRLKLTELSEPVVDAFYAEEIGVGHALLLAKLQSDQQQQALAACFRKDWSGAGKQRRILLPVRNLQYWIDNNILLVLKGAPFGKKEGRQAGASSRKLHRLSQTHRPQRALIFRPRQAGRLHRPNLLPSESRGACRQKRLPRSRSWYKSVRSTDSRRKEAPFSHATSTRRFAPRSPRRKKRPSGPSSKSANSPAKAIVTEGHEKGELRKVCSNPVCPIHHSVKHANREDGKWKAEQEQRRKRRSHRQKTTGIRVLSAIGAAVPVRLLKRDLQFLLNQITPLLDECRLQTLARQYGIRKDRDTDSIEKLFSAFVRRADEGTHSRLLVESTLLLAAARTNPAVLRDAAATYKVDTDAIAQKVKQEFAAKKKARKAVKPAASAAAKTNKAA
jgi:ParB family transcriptional regulator, chromosome partitioning protein